MIFRIQFLYFLSLVFAQYQSNYQAIPPLSTRGNLIVDTTNHAVHLHCTSWAGAHMEDYVTFGVESQNLTVLVDFIEQSRFNCVRLQFSAEMVYKNPVINDTFLKDYNPGLLGMRAMDVYSAIVKELTRRKIMVILDFHMLDAKWCCDQLDDNGGWFNDRWTEQNATDQMLTMVKAFVDDKYVIGMDLRNEIRPRMTTFPFLGIQIPFIHFYPSWGMGGQSDWASAAERMANAMHTVNPELLAFVQGLFVVQMDNFFHLLSGKSIQTVRIPQTLKSVRWRPILLNVPDKVVYSSHDYSWHYSFDWTQPVDYEDYKRKADENYGYVADTYPLFMGEIGTGNFRAGVEDNQHWQHMIRYFKAKRFHWAVWEFSGNERSHAPVNTFAIMSPDHSKIQYQPLVDSLQSIMF